MAQRLKIIGNYISPYVRKVLVCLELKGLDYEIDPIAPFIGDDEFSRLSPLRQVPVLLDGDFALSDSSVICQYLEDRHPEPSLYPADPARRARARWLEEYADIYLGEAVMRKLFYQRVRRHLFGETSDEEAMRQAREEMIPAALDYLEAQLPAEGYLFGALAIADIAIACFFRNAAYVRYAIDAGRWPRSAAYVERILALDAFRKLAVYEDGTLRTPVHEQRKVLAELGAPISEATVGNSPPRHGVLSAGP